MAKKYYDRASDSRDGATDTGKPESLAAIRTRMLQGWFALRKWHVQMDYLSALAIISCEMFPRKSQFEYFLSQVNIDGQIPSLNTIEKYMLVGMADMMKRFEGRGDIRSRDNLARYHHMTSDEPMFRRGDGCHRAGEFYRNRFFTGNITDKETEATA